MDADTYDLMRMVEELDRNYAEARADDDRRMAEYLATLGGKCEQCEAQHLPGIPLCRDCLDSWGVP